MKIVCFGFLLMCALGLTSLIANEGDFMVI
ncbi:putative membrane protein (plasmid) [Candidatus Protochlamydia naegleriophila]|uniref:Putative membrane protein n=1 Tax=Candidatus Protochlamydia naegleriophila TaxID=389348 RepID=A0A0U5EV30_9BACT|nr:putative membrane protein [Candidatus Protochlamydia naegleriophila]